jgi:hypothetical protein
LDFSARGWLGRLIGRFLNNKPIHANIGVEGGNGKSLARFLAASD